MTRDECLPARLIPLASVVSSAERVPEWGKPLTWQKLTNNDITIETAGIAITLAMPMAKFAGSRDQKCQ
jgi:hypothetical protein